ncbi:MAG: helix-turn-helix domain-containing protein [Deltaproteobacteria bacterium]|jgi:predicted transcriptional regulator|nr:helix-turn-helix domain-containing protein [Deltaproteobacteria bacterium]
MQIIKDAFKQSRQKMMLSRTELARKAGVSIGVINRLENGEMARMENIKKVIEALGCSADDSQQFLTSF